MSQSASNPVSPNARGVDLDELEFVTVEIDKQWFGIPVLTVRDVLGTQKIADVPLAPPEVSGSLNLRGRIVTAIDPRVRLGISARDDDEPNMGVVVEHQGELYSLLIDQVGEVLRLPADRYEDNPASLDSRWRDVSAGIYRLDDRLLVIMDVARLLDFDKAAAA